MHTNSLFTDYKEKKTLPTIKGTLSDFSQTMLIFEAPKQTCPYPNVSLPHVRTQCWHNDNRGNKRQPACVWLLYDKKILLDKLQDIARLELGTFIILCSWMEKSQFTRAFILQWLFFNKCEEPSLSFLSQWWFTCAWIIFLRILIWNYAGNQEPFAILTWYAWSHNQLTYGNK